MAESLPPSGHRYGTRRNSRKRSLEVDESQREGNPAEPSVDKHDEAGPESEASSSKAGQIDCAICLQSCVHPTRLPCGHIFCFLCMKGVFRASAKCAMCRRPIPRSFLETPDLLEIPDPSSAVPEEDAFHWFYEGRHGWWEYDQRANAELEAAFVAGESKVELLIAGYVYLVDLHGMMQYRKTDPGRRRAVKRDKVGTACKGVAGIRPTVLQAMGEQRRAESDSRRNSMSLTGSIVEALDGLSLEDDEIDLLYGTPTTTATAWSGLGDTEYDTSGDPPSGELEDDEEVELYNDIDDDTESVGSFTLNFLQYE